MFIPVIAAVVLLLNTNFAISLSDYSSKAVAFAYSGYDICYSGTAAS